MKIFFVVMWLGKVAERPFLNMSPTSKELGLDFVIVNVENAAHGFGITQGICQEFYNVGVDVISTGNHIWDQRNAVPYFCGSKALAYQLSKKHPRPRIYHCGKIGAKS